MTGNLPPYDTLSDDRSRSRVKRAARRLAREAINRGVSPRVAGWRYVPRRTPREAAERFARGGATLETIHPPAVADHPLPVNVADRDRLPADAGWWGYSFHDVPSRASGETLIATVPECRIVGYRDPDRGDDYFPAILTADGHALDLRETRFRERHAVVLRDGAGSAEPQRVERATWIIERVYHNHSHWLNAHLPKVALLKKMGRLDEMILPTERSAAMDDSLRLLGIDPSAQPSYDPVRPLHVGRLTLMQTDRFRPELLRLVSEAFGVNDALPPTRRVYITRERAARRRLLNEAAVWDTLEPAGFEKVFMEDLSFAEQVGLMKETAVLVGPHGAGLTNMLFMPAGGTVVEIADLGFPNPNFYATAAAMGHRYFILEAESIGDGPPVERDLRFDVSRLVAAMPTVMGEAQ